jgi:hypothetical protein
LQFFGHGLVCGNERSCWSIRCHAARPSSRRARWLVRRRSSGVPMILLPSGVPNRLIGSAARCQPEVLRLAGCLLPAPASPSLAADLPAGTCCLYRDAPPHHRPPEEAKASSGRPRGPASIGPTSPLHQDMSGTLRARSACLLPGWKRLPITTPAASAARLDEVLRERPPRRPPGRRRRLDGLRVLVRCRARRLCRRLDLRYTRRGGRRPPAQPARPPRQLARRDAGRPGYGVPDHFGHQDRHRGRRDTAAGSRDWPTWTRRPAATGASQLMPPSRAFGQALRSRRFHFLHGHLLTNPTLVTTSGLAHRRNFLTA